jgi:hypothetical protein
MSWHDMSVPDADEPPLATPVANQWEKRKQAAAQKADQEPKELEKIKNKYKPETKLMMKNSKS